MTNKANKATTTATNANDATNKATPATNDATQATPATPPIDERGFEAFVKSNGEGGKVPSHVTPRMFASWFLISDKQVRDWLRTKGVYATAHKGADGPRHMYPTTGDDANATRRMFDAMRERFEGRTSNGKGASRGVSFVNAEW